MPTELPILKPKRLSHGDTIGLIAPASPQNEDDGITAAIDTLRSIGFNVKPGAHLYERWGYLAGSDQSRASDLNAAFADDEVDGIICIGGGYGSARLLPYIDYELIKQQPKMLMGYSDITALLNGIHHKTGLVTFHGTNAGVNWSDYFYQAFQKVVMQPAPQTSIGEPPAFDIKPGQIDRKNRLNTISGGKATGRLIGGNLSLLGTLAGTAYMPDYSGKLVFIEEVGEDTYRVDRYLTQLWLTGDLQKAAGIAFGKFTNCGTKASWAKQLTMQEVLTARCESLGIPVVRGLMIGHIEDQTVVPVGALAELDADARTLTLLEPAVL